MLIHIQIFSRLLFSVLLHHILKSSSYLYSENAHGFSSPILYGDAKDLKFYILRVFTNNQTKGENRFFLRSTRFEYLRGNTAWLIPQIKKALFCIDIPLNTFSLTILFPKTNESLKPEKIPQTQKETTFKTQGLVS